MKQLHHLTSVISLAFIFCTHTVISNAVPRTDFWIGDTGPTGPIFSGIQQYPFICFSFENGLGQPLVDNQNGIGNAVFPEFNGFPLITADPIGYSEYCSLNTRVDYFYYSNNADNFLPLANPAQIPDDVEIINLHGRQVKFVVRLERGTINRFIYSIAMLAPFTESLDRPNKLNNSAWNRKLVYKFQGGIGLGHWQGNFALNKEQALHYESLSRGYAVAYSTGTRTSTHYNLKLAEETALMVKQHFIQIYGRPIYTVGIGGSGGAIQQYVIAQNNPDIIDAAIPQLSYPDMITQITHVSDCELLERYFDQQYSIDNSSRWGNWLERILIEGMAANSTALKQPWSLSPYAPLPGMSVCVNGWRGQVPSMLNPSWAPAEYIEALTLYRYPAEVIDNIKWSHWNDLGNIYPQDADGVAANSWDNVGVQYGLRALRNGDINIREFLNLNACAGGWKASQQMQLGAYPWDPDADPATLDPWDQLNMNLSENCATGQPAARTEGNVAAMNIAYTSGHVFRGELNIPIIDLRWYLEPVLDMHHSIASFQSRARMLKHQGHARNQVIWVAACSELDAVNLNENCAYNPTADALDAIDRWIHNVRIHPNRGLAQNKPSQAQDTCFNIDGSVIATGPGVWDGILNGNSKGACTNVFPPYSTSRIEAGEDLNGDIFKCDLKTVNAALSDDTYGNVIITAEQKLRLKEIFPQGVCNYENRNSF